MGCCVGKNRTQVKYAAKEDNSTANKMNQSASVLVQSKNLVLEKKSKVKDSYKILNKLGEGSFGSVYKVLDKTTKIIRAMKVIKKETLQDQDDEQIFLKEIEILKTIDHPNIVKIFEYYTDEHNYYIIIEFVTGGELYTEITGWTTFSEKKAAFITKQLLSAIFYLHSLNIVHRDVKPENIMIETNKASEEELSIKLIDFGTCNYLEPGSFLKQTMGTPYFVAPEVLNGKYNNTCDIWSIGVTLYILLCGFPPFHGKNPDEIFAEIKKCKFSFNFKEFKNISDEAKDLISRMLNPDFKDRIQAKDALQHIWIKKFENEEKVDNIVLKSVLHNIKSFNAKEKLQQTAIAYIVHLVQNTKENDELKKIFGMIDKNGDGRLTYDELKEGFERVFGENLTEYEFEKIVGHIDQDEDGFIGYEEFLRVALDQKIILTEQNLKMAYMKFDENGDGSLSIEEIKRVMGAEDGPYFREIIGKLKLTSDGEVSYENFRNLMKTLVKKIDKSKSMKQQNSIGSYMGRTLKPSGTLSIKKENYTSLPKKNSIDASFLKPENKQEEK